MLRNENNNVISDDEVNNVLTDDEVNQIPVIELNEEIEDDCSICLEHITINSNIYDIPCNHKFHINCLKPYLLSYNRTCPLCRNECFSHI